MDSILDNFYTTFQKEEVKYLNELGITTDNYYNQTKYVSNVMTKGNLAFRKPVKANPAPSTLLSNGDLSLLTDGVYGDDVDLSVYRWLGWEEKDIEIVLDLGQSVIASSVEMNTLCIPDPWRRVLHPFPSNVLFQIVKRAVFIRSEKFRWTISSCSLLACIPFDLISVKLMISVL